MNKIIVAFAAVAAMTFSVGVAEAGSKGKNKQTGQFTSGGLVNVSPNVAVGGILNGGILNGAAILSGNTTGVGILGTGILSSSKTIKDSFNDNSKNKKR
jgi:hypothetical protein